ncbi:multidrug DMT transporter permease [Burkholderia stagnalis]|uniref:EamA family transporter n=1 Tax=Burkholderia stagnalis TaxID=1503054 RepID=A0A6L3MU65_9BURK|nr:DMT family transporter [Burkholderia stagnalis]KAB0636442.1 EamA family transporter [Burkholderia stagnalis]KVO35770.1 multidrug DMT transporter permease [Burkholderia stagnalis]KVO73708.1 multidrug DMT transporter permease [Burkholderia stagnalis]KVW53816.1 multidrug DMT transporter permease [Burkholderia stagnalis]KVW70571.1 multidrug DMT transporter permease [Burkholderia stagnalis]
MPIPILFAVLSAALLHASWNALVRSSGDRLWSATVLCIAMGLFAAVLIPFTPFPVAASWTCVVASAVLHVLYNLLLVHSYHQGDLSVSYPVARGTSPLLVTLGAAVFAGERLGAGAVAGLLMISAGIVAIGLDREKVSQQRVTKALPAALATGATIAAYSVVDGIGVRHNGDATGYTAWMFMLTAWMMAAYFRVVKGPIRLSGSRAELAKAGFGGVFAALAYGIVIWAMQRGPMGPISSLRETSVVFAALIGRVCLGERLSIRRSAGCGIIAAGAVLISLSGLAR